MKPAYKLVLLSLLFLSVFSSCVKEMEPEERTLCATATCLALTGEWNLMQYSGGLMGFENYNKDDLTWTFNNNGMVDVLINNTPLIF